VSADGKTYTTLIDGVFSPKSNAGSGTVKLDISGYASASTTIQFIVTGVGGGDSLSVDNVQVSYDTGAANSAPTISSNGGGTTASVTVGENSTVVTTVTATDVDAGHTLGYSIAGGADAGRFTINNSTGQLSFASAPSYEAPADSGGNNVYDVTVQVSDGQGGTDTQALAVTVANVNEAPTDLALSANTVAENAANGTVVGTVSGTDSDTGDTRTYSLTDNAGGRFAINSSAGQITVANRSLINYESATSHNLTVRVTDSGGLTYDETFTINVTDFNEAAPRITSNGGGATALINIAENATAVTRVTASDADTRQTLAYSIVGGPMPPSLRSTVAPVPCRLCPPRTTRCRPIAAVTTPTM
jgi:type III secretion system FlhB-like substrate exporter